MIEPEEVAQKLDRRDGATVVAFREIGLPVFRLNCLLTLQEHSPIGAIEEFLLRCVGRGLSTTNDLTQFLGLPAVVVTQKLGQLIFEGAIAEQIGTTPQYGVTPLGRSRLEFAGMSRISKEQVPIYVDGVTRRVIPIESKELWSNAQLEMQGIAPVPPTPRRAPTITEVDMGDVNHMFALMAGGEAPTKRAIKIDALVGRTFINFRRAVAVAFKSHDGRNVSIGFAIDGRESEEHEVEYARSPDLERSMLFGGMFDSDRRRAAIRAAARELKRDVPTIFDADSKKEGARPLLKFRHRRDEKLISSNGVRVLSVYDHPPLLTRAMEVAKDRVLIVSPWIRSNVVNEDFVSRLVSCLDRGVKVTIAYGIGREDRRERPSDQAAREALIALTRSFKNFRLVRKGDTHAKVLLVDSLFFVTTSFNWLSFRGDPQQPMREEEGTMVEVPELVEEYFKKLSARIEEAELKH